MTFLWKLQPFRHKSRPYDYLNGCEGGYLKYDWQLKFVFLKKDNCSPFLCLSLVVTTFLIYLSSPTPRTTPIIPNPTKLTTPGSNKPPISKTHYFTTPRSSSPHKIRKFQISQPTRPPLSPSQIGLFMNPAATFCKPSSHFIWHPTPTWISPTVLTPGSINVSHHTFFQFLSFFEKVVQEPTKPLRSLPL